MNGAPNGVIAHDAKGAFDIDALLARARAWPGLEGMDLAKDVSARQTYKWNDGLWSLAGGYAADKASADAPHVVAIDYGIKRNILRRSEEHTSELQSLMRNSYAVLCLTKKTTQLTHNQ